MSSLPQPLPPVPVQSIAYSTPVSNRPGLITAIGVISIVAGSLGLMFNGVAGLQAFVMIMVAQTSQAAAAAATARQAVVAPPKPVDPLSMPAADRQTVVRGLATHRAISKERREQLDALLVKCGRQVFRLSGPNLTAEVVRQNVNDSGPLPDAKGGADLDFFIVGEGRIELADDHAKFAPADGSEIVRVNAFDSGEQPNWEAGLTAAQVKGIIDRVKTDAKATLPAAQTSKLEVLLNTPTQEYFDPVPTVDEATAQIRTVAYVNSPETLAAGSAGQLTLMTGKGHIVLDGLGNTVIASTWGGNARGGGFGGGGAVFAKVNTTAAVVALACAGLSLALAIYLLVIGILMLRQHPRAGRLHKVYAWLKIPVAIAGAIAWIAFWNSITWGAPAVGFSRAMIAAAVVAVVVGCLYPVSLLIALRTRGAREYYAAVQ